MNSSTVTIIIPVYNAQNLLAETIESILKQAFQSENKVEIIIWDDCSTDQSYQIGKKYAEHYKEIRIFKNEKNSGPAVTRNNAIKEADGDILTFIDSDCIADNNWLSNIVKCFQDSDIGAVQGNIKIPKSTFLGDSISALGFPGGGSVGFDKMWRVSSDGLTDHITSANFAARREVFLKFGDFDESFPYPGGEDPELSYRWSRCGVKIKFCPDAIVYHQPRKDLSSFIKWMIIRGKSNYYFKKKVGSVKSFVRLRLWSSGNIIKKYWNDPKIILIIPLLFLSFVLQQWGYILEAYKKRFQ